MSVVLTDKQQDLLRRFVEGVKPADVSYGQRASARALERRGLVTITSSGESWRYEVTDAGRKWRAVSPPVPGTTNGPTPRTASKAAKNAGTLFHALVEKTVSAGGELWDAEDVGRAEAIIKSGLRIAEWPGAHVLRVNGIGRDRTLSAIERPDWMTGDVGPVVVPHRVARFHPAVREARETRDFAEAVSESQRGRALRILHAIAIAAEGRGWSVTCPITAEYQRPRPGLVSLTVRDHASYLYVRQDYDRTPHVPPKTELREAERSSWHRIPDYDHVPADRLIVTIGRGYGETVFKDTKTTRLDDKLAGLLRVVEYAAFEQEQRRLEREAEEKRRRQQWEVVREQAERDLQRHARRVAVDEQVKAWEQHRLREDFLAAAREHAESLTGGDRAAADEWLEWCLADHSSRDPWRGFRAPEPVEATPQALEPFMRGLSAYGPHGSYGWASWVTGRA